MDEKLPKTQKFSIIKERIIKTSQIIEMYKSKQELLGKATRAFKNVKSLYEKALKDLKLMEQEKSVLLAKNNTLTSKIDEISLKNSQISMDLEKNEKQLQKYSETEVKYKELLGQCTCHELQETLQLKDSELSRLTEMYKSKQELLSKATRAFKKLKSLYEQGLRDIKALEQEKLMLCHTNNTLTSQIDDLNVKYNEIVLERNNMKPDCDKLVQKYSKIMVDNQKTEAKYQKLLEQCTCHKDFIVGQFKYKGVKEYRELKVKYDQLKIKEKSLQEELLKQKNEVMVSTKERLCLENRQCEDSFLCKKEEDEEEIRQIFEDARMINEIELMSRFAESPLIIEDPPSIIITPPTPNEEIMDNFSAKTPLFPTSAVIRQIQVNRRRKYWIPNAYNNSRASKKFLHKVGKLTKSLVFKALRTSEVKALLSELIRPKRPKKKKKLAEFTSETESELERLFKKKDVLKRNRRLIALAKAQNVESQDSDMLDSGLVTASSKNGTDSSVYSERNAVISSLLKPSKSPLNAPKSPLNAPKSPLNAQKSPLNAPKSPLNAPKSPLNAPRSPSEPPTSPLDLSISPLKSPKRPSEPINSLKSPSNSILGIIENSLEAWKTPLLSPLIPSPEKTTFSVTIIPKKISFDEKPSKIWLNCPSGSRSQKPMEEEKEESSKIDISMDLYLTEDDEATERAPKRKSTVEALATESKIARKEPNGDVLANILDCMGPLTFAQSNNMSTVTDLDSPLSPDVIELPSKLPKLIPLEKPEKLTSDDACDLIDKLIMFCTSEYTVNNIVIELSGQNTDYIARLVLNKLCVDIDRTRTTLNPRCPPLTPVQQTLLGFLCKLEKSHHPGILDKFLDLGEMRVCDPKTPRLSVENVTRLFCAICKMRHDLYRIRRFLLNCFYCKNNSIPLGVFFTVLRMYPQVLPVQNDDDYLTKTLVYICYTKISKRPEDCPKFLHLRDLLKNYYTYTELSLEKIFTHLFDSYVKNPALKHIECALMLLLIHQYDKWTFTKLQTSFWPLYTSIPANNVNLKATLILFIGKVCGHFGQVTDDIMSKICQWFKLLLDVETDALIVRSVNYVYKKYPKLKLNLQESVVVTVTSLS